MAGSVAVGLIGLGSINDVHRRNLAVMPDVKIAAVSDPVAERAQAVAADVGGGCRAFTDYRELIERAGVDCLFIAIPPHRHTEEVILAARQGLPFLVEKPIVRSLTQARTIEREIVRSGVLHAVGYHNRYLPACDAAREALDGAAIGMAMGFTFWKEPVERDQPKWHHWVFDDAQGGGQLHEHTTHIFDLARYLVGEVRTVFAQRVQRLPHEQITNYATSDVNTVNLVFTSGALGLVGAGHMTPRRYWWGLHILTDRAILEYTPARLRVLSGDSEREVAAELPHGAHFVQDSAFIRAVRTGDRSPIRSTYSDAIRSAAISLAALESSEAGQTVDVEAVLERSLRGAT